MNKKISIGDLILLGLEKTVDGVVRMNDYAYHSYIYAAGYDRPLKQSTVSQTLRRLREKGLIDFVDQDKLLIRITDAGKSKALRQKFYQTGYKWDGKWRLVSFDIPEKRRSARDLLRYHLKSWGFKPWQQSLWASKADCTKELRDFVKEVGIERWVVIIESSNVK